MAPNPDDPLHFINGPVGDDDQRKSGTDLITDLLYEIIRVKEIIKYYEAMPEDEGVLAASILTELVSEAHRSLVDYDTVLMRKYYELLLNCD